MQFLHSLKRNHYFKGKLLTAKDFTFEQRYHSNKVSLLTKLHYEPGIIYGLQVIKNSDDVLLIKKGVALDGDGRMIILANDYVSKIDAISGFESTNDCMHLYLNYKENGMDYSYQALSDKLDHMEYDTIYESYQISVEKKYCQDMTWKHFFHLFQLYEDDHVLIMQRLPKVLPKQGAFHLLIDIYNKKFRKDLKIGLQYDLEVAGLYGDALAICIEKTRMVPFHTTYTFVIRHKRKQSNLTFVCSMIKVVINGNITQKDITYHQTISCRDDVKRFIKRTAREQNNYGKKIYLGSFSYEWQEQQWVIKNVVSQVEHKKVMNEKVRSLYERVVQAYGLNDTNSVAQDVFCKRMDIEEFTLQSDGLYVSEWLLHPIDECHSHFDLSFETTKKKQSYLYYGSLFDDNEKTESIVYGIKLDLEKGLFKIMLQVPKKLQINGIYYYIKAVKQVESERKDAHLMSLDPALITLSPKGSCHFVPIFDDVEFQQPVTFQADGGVIYENGYYLAPEEEGIYHVRAIDTLDNVADSYICVRKQDESNQT